MAARLPPAQLMSIQRRRGSPPVRLASRGSTGHQRVARDTRPSSAAPAICQESPPVIAQRVARDPRGLVDFARARAEIPAGRRDWRAPRLPPRPQRVDWIDCTRAAPGYQSSHQRAAQERSVMQRFGCKAWSYVLSWCPRFQGIWF